MLCTQFPVFYKCHPNFDLLYCMLECSSEFFATRTRRVGVSRYGNGEFRGSGSHGANLRALPHAASIFVGCWPITTDTLYQWQKLS